jgi:hypothetical protein
MSMWFEFMQNMFTKSLLNSRMFDFDKIRSWSADKKWKLDGFEIMASSMWRQRFGSKVGASIYVASVLGWPLDILISQGAKYISIGQSKYQAATRVKSQYNNFDKSWRTYFVPCFILKKGTKCVRQDLSKVFVLWLDSKGQLISKCPFGLFKLTKKPTKFL